MIVSHPLFRRFENELSIAERKLEWTISDEDLVLRPQGAHESIVWFFLGRADIGRTLFYQPQGRHGSFKVEQSLHGGMFWRWWHLESGEECFLRKRYGIFRAANGELVRFDFPSPIADFLEVGGEELNSFLKKLSSPQSDLEAATLWSRTPVQERVRQLFRLSGGTHDQLEALIQASLVLSADETTFSVRPEIPGRVLLWRQGAQWNAKPIDRFFDILNRYFYLERTEQEWRGHDDLGDPADIPYPIYSATESTQHERLEALLAWRDFLHDKLPSEEIEALLKV